MIKEQSFECLLEGCHRIADVAVAYYPNYAYACSAVKAPVSYTHLTLPTNSRV